MADNIYGGGIACFVGNDADIVSMEQEIEKHPKELLLFSMKLHPADSILPLLVVFRPWNDLPNDACWKAFLCA
jgi:hypothetical protein